MKCKDVVFTLAVPVPGATSNGEFKDRFTSEKYQLDFEPGVGLWGKGEKADSWDFYPGGIIKRVGGVVREKSK